MFALTVTVGAAYAILDGRIRATGAYILAMERVDTDTYIGESLGRPISRGLWVDSERGEFLTLRIPLSGTLKGGTLELVSTPDASAVDSMVLVVDGTRTDLLARDARVLLQNLAWEAVTVGAAELKAGNYAAAEQKLSEALELDDSLAHATFLRGQARLAQGKAEEAEADLRRAAQLDPADPEIPAALGEMFASARRYDDCIDAYTDVLNIDAENNQAWYRRALCYERKRDYRRATAGAREGCSGGLEDSCEMEARLKRRGYR